MKTLIVLFLGLVVQSIQAQTVNNWTGDATGGNWNDRYKWKLNHPPAENESAYFREPNSVITVNSTVQLNYGMHLYGKELLLKGNGNINLWSLVPHQRTVNIPASATGFANLTLTDNLSLNGRIALSATGFGTSASKGTITLKGHSTVTGDLAVGNTGQGSGQVIVKDNATYRITDLELATKASVGGLAEIQILGGTVKIETEENPFDMFLEDASRKIIIGDAGTLRVESDLPIATKKELLKEMISNNRLVAAPSCFLTTPILQGEMLLVHAENQETSTNPLSIDDLLTAIDEIPEGESTTQESTTSPLGDIVKGMNSAMKGSEAATSSTEEEQETPMSGYIVFFGAILLVLRRPRE